MRWRALWPALLGAATLGSQCPGDDHVDRWIIIDALPAGVSSEIAVPAQSMAVKVRFRRETASQDIELAPAVSVDGQVVAPDASGTPTAAGALLCFEDLETPRSYVVSAPEGRFLDRNLAPGLYDLAVIPDQDLSDLAIAYRQVTLPDDDLSVIDLEVGEHELEAVVAVYDLLDVPTEERGIPDIYVEVFTELDDGTLRRHGPRTTTDADGAFSVLLAEGRYTLRLSAAAEAAFPYPTVLITGFEVPGDIDALWEEAEAEGRATPILFTYPAFESRSLSGTLISTGPLSEAPEGNAAVTVRGIVEPASIYRDVDAVDFEIGYLERLVYSDSEGHFALSLPPAVYTMDIVPGYYAQSSSQRWDGAQAIDLLDDDLQLGDVPLTSRVYLSLVVGDEQGRAVEGAQIEIHDDQLSGFTYGAVTTETGAARLKLDQGRHRITVIPPADSSLARGSFDVEMGLSDVVREVVLSQGIQVSGRVSLEGELLGGVQLRLSDPSDGTVLGVGTSRASGTYDLRIPSSWAWPEPGTDGDDDDTAPD